MANVEEASTRIESAEGSATGRRCQLEHDLGGPAILRREESLRLFGDVARVHHAGKLLDALHPDRNRPALLSRACAVDQFVCSRRQRRQRAWIHFEAGDEGELLQWHAVRRRFDLHEIFVAAAHRRENSMRRPRLDARPRLPAPVE